MQEKNREGMVMMEHAISIDKKPTELREKATSENNILESFTQRRQTIMDKLKILTDAAKYDVSCSSSGVERKGNGRDMGTCSAAGICHSFSADGRCISLLKILFSNECFFIFTFLKVSSKLNLDISLQPFYNTSC